MNGLFKVSIAGTDATSYTNTVRLTEDVGRMYNVVTMTLGRRPSVNAEVNITLGDKQFNGFVFSVDKDVKNNYTVICRSHSAKLTTPYFNNSDYALENATTSHALCRLYAKKYKIPIINNAVDLAFGGNYERRGTPLDTLAKIANITGAECWYDGSSIIISPNKAITDIGTPISDNDIFDFIPSSDNLYNEGVGRITIGTEEYTDSISTDVSCTATVDKCSGEAIVRVIPHSSFVSSSGISLVEVITPMLYSSVIAPSFSIKLDAEIASVLSIYINGEEITDYNFNVDTIFFTTEKRGITMVDFVGYGYRGYANIIRAGVDRYCEFDIYYGPCEKYSFQDTMNCEAEEGYSMCGGMLTITPKDMNYAKGFTFYTIGGNPKITFYSKTKIINKPTISVNKSIDWVEKATLSIESNKTIRHKLRFSPTTITEVRANGVNITQHTTLKGEYIEFDDMYLGVVIAYTTQGVEHYVNFKENMPKDEVRMLIGGDTAGACEFPLLGYSQDSTSSTICVEGVTVPVDMIEELGVQSFQATRKSVLVTYPSGKKETISTDSFGILKIPNVAFGEYTLDVNNILPNTKMKLMAGGM